MLAKTKTYQLITTEKDLARVANDLEDYCKIFGNKKPKLAFDLETWSLTGRHKPILLPDGTYEAYSRLFQIGLDPAIEDCQFLIDIMALNGISGKVPLTKKQMKAERMISEYLGDILKKSIIIGQGLNFDAKYLIEHYDLWLDNLRCTMLLSQIINAGDKYTERLDKRSHKLYSLYEYFIDFGLFKSLTKNSYFPDGMTPIEYGNFKGRMQKEDWGQFFMSEEQLIYGSQDVQLIHYLYKRQIEVLEEIIKKHNQPGLVNTYRLECAAINEFAVAEIVGIQPDIQYYDEEVVPYLNKYVEDSENALMAYPEFWQEDENLTTTIKLLDGQLKISNRRVSIPYSKFINLNSKATAKGPGQLQNALERCGIKVPNAQRQTFEELLYDPDNEATLTEKQKIILSKVIQYLKAKSMLTKYGPNLYSGEDSKLYLDGKFHPDIFQMGGEENGVDTQRTSIKNPALQTIPSGSDDYFGDGETIGHVLRKPYVPSLGKILGVADFSNQEVRLATQLTKDQYLITVFTENRDQHAETARDTLGLDYLPAKGTPERAAGKVGYLGHQYQQGWKGMQANIYEATKCKLWIPDNQAREMKKKLKFKYSGITKKSEQCHIKVQKALEPYESLKYFENRRPIFIGFTELKYDTEMLKDIISIDGKEAPFTRLRRWCLHINQERMIKRQRKGLKDFKIKKKSLKHLAKLFKSKLLTDENGMPYKPPVMVFRKFVLGRILRRIKPMDTLHRNYSIYNSERDEWETWNNEFNRRANTISREYFNFLIQPEGSTILKLSMIGIGKEFRKRGWNYREACVILECHDEIIIEVIEELKDEAMKIMLEVMERVMKSVVKCIPAPVEGKLAYSWADGK